MRPQNFGLVTNNDNDRHRHHCVCGAENVVDERSTAGAVQNLGDRRLHARPLTGGEHYHVEVWTSGFGRHRGPPTLAASLDAAGSGLGLGSEDLVKSLDPLERLEIWILYGYRPIFRIKGDGLPQVDECQGQIALVY